MKNVLIVEDSPTVAQMLEAVLSEQGYAVTIAVSGEEALEKAEEKVFDVAVVDTLLPGIDGFEVTAALKKTEKQMNVKIIVTTAVVDAIDAAKARSYGADDYVVKTSDFEPLIDAVAKLI
jgi:DNA-binding response OmpR family regulator